MRRVVTLAVAATVVFVCGFAKAEMPRTLSVQGRLTDTTGQALQNGSYEMDLDLFTVPSGGTPIWSEHQAAVGVVDGLFSIALGNSTPLDVPFNQQYYLQIEIGSGPGIVAPVVFPGRIPLTSGPYALGADSANIALGASPIGPAGGDLNGSYPNPDLAPNAVGSLEIADQSIQSSDVSASFKAPRADTADYASAAALSRPISPGISSAELLDGSIERIDVAVDFKAPHSDSADHADAAPPIGTAGGDLSGSYPNPVLGTNSVGSSEIIDGSIQRTDVETSFKAPYSDSADYAGSAPLVRPITPGVGSLEIADGAVSSIDLATGAVTQAKIADLQVTNGKISDGAVTTEKMADAAVNTGKLSDNSVTNVKLAEGSVTTGKLLDASVTNAKLGPQAVTSDKIQNYTIQTEDLSPTIVVPNADSISGIPASRNQVPNALYPLNATGGLELRRDGPLTKDADSAAAIGPLAAFFVGYVGGKVLDVVLEGLGDAVGINAPNGGTALHCQSPSGYAGLFEGNVQVNGGSLTVQNTIIGSIQNSEQLGGYLPGNAGSTIPISNGQVCVNLNADKLDGIDGSNFVNVATDYGRFNVVSDLYEGTSTLTNRYVNEGQSNSITSSMIQSGAIGSSHISTSADVTLAAITAGNINYAVPASAVEGFSTAVDGAYGYTGRTDGTGVTGRCDNGTLAYGLWGRSTTGYAGYFNGKVHVNGALSKSSGTFKIDHPLDPANKYLSHSFAESPEMLNIYRGAGELHGGVATVELPSYFSALNSDPTVSLTCVGGYSALYAEEVAGNSFVVRLADGNPDQRFHWVVYGVRKDAWALQNPVIVEEEKESDLRGRYLNPKVFGLPEERSIEMAKPSN